MPRGLVPWLMTAAALAHCFMSPLAIAGHLLISPASAQPRPAEELVGVWLLACHAATVTKPEPCIMRHRDWVLQPGSGGLSAALEVQARDGALVPVVTLRGIPAQAALGTSLLMKPQVHFHYDAGPPIGMTCGLSGIIYACAPDAPLIAAAASGLRPARSITVRIELSIPGMFALPPQEQRLDLSGTSQALARLAATGGLVSDEALPAVPGLDLRGFLDRVLRGAGFENGIADLLPAILPLVGALKG